MMQDVLAIDFVVEQVEAVVRLRLRLELQLPLKVPDLIGCLQAHHQSPTLFSVKSAPEVRVLSSAGVTRLRRSYDPVRLPRGPAPYRAVEAATPVRHGSPPITRPTFSNMPCPLPRWTGTGASVGCFPAPRGPSPYIRRVGVHIITFEACSGFTRVTACWIAQPPKAAFVTRLRPVRLPVQAARQLPGPTDNFLGGSLLHW